MRGNRVKSAESELIRILAAFYTAEIGLTAHGGGGKIYYKFPGIFNNIVGIPLRTDRNIGHRRMRTDDSRPSYRKNVGSLKGSAAYESRRNRGQQSASLPELFWHNIHQPDLYFFHYNIF